MTKEILAKLMNGVNCVVAIAELKEPESYVLVIATTGEKYVVPMIRKDGIGSAYIDPKIDKKKAVFLSEIVSTIFLEKIFPIFKYTPVASEAPTGFDHTVTKFIKPTGMNYILPKLAKETLELAGYKLELNKATDSPFIRRDYGTQIADNPDFQKQYDAEVKKLTDAGVTYEDLPSEIKTQYEAVEAGVKDGLIFVGPAGTGKTWLTMALAAHAKAHRVDLQMDPTTLPEDLEGQYVCDDREGSSSTWRFQEGPLLRAYYLGYAACIQEIGYAEGGTRSCLNKYLDGTLQIEAKNGKIYHRHPNFVVYATMNPGVGTPLTRALKNRLTFIQVPALSEDEFISRLIKHSEFINHKISLEFAKEIFKFSQLIDNKAKAGNWHESLEFSIRNAKSFLSTIFVKPKDFQDFADALHAEYTNALSCDYDNTQKLITLKQDPEMIGIIKKMYSFYDFFKEEYAEEALDNLDSLMPSETSESYDYNPNDDETAKGLFSGDQLDNIIRKYSGKE